MGKPVKFACTNFVYLELCCVQFARSLFFFLSRLPCGVSSVLSGTCSIYQMFIRLWP